MNISDIRKDFPILNTKINGNSLIYFDNAATSQKPQSMINSLVNFYQFENSNTHSNHFLASNLTQKIEDIRTQILEFVKADPKIYSVIFTKSATEGINLIANGFSKILENSRILLTEAEHHSNLLPWQKIAKINNSRLDFIKILENGDWDLSNIEKLMDTPTKLVSINWVSNVLGIINPVQKLVELCQQKDIFSVIDATQAIPHLDINLTDFQPDFLVFSGHKIFGPTGIGVLIVKTKILDELEVYQTGGEMVKSATLMSSQFYSGYQRFEAGTLNFAEIIGLSESLKYISELKLKQDIFEYETKLFEKLFSNLKSITGLKIIGDSNNKIPLIAFYHPSINDYDLSVFLDLKGVAVRSGKHCAEPLHKVFNLNSSIRASLAFYNTFEEIDNFTKYLDEAILKLK